MYAQYFDLNKTRTLITEAVVESLPNGNVHVIVKNHQRAKLFFGHDEVWWEGSHRGFCDRRRVERLSVWLEDYYWIL